MLLPLFVVVVVVVVPQLLLLLLLLQSVVNVFVSGLFDPEDLDAHVVLLLREQVVQQQLLPEQADATDVITTAEFE